MQKGIIVSNDPIIRKECKTQIEPLKGIQLLFTDSLDSLDKIENSFNFLFILIHNFHKLSLERLIKLQKYFPAVAIILYNDSLISDALTKLCYFSGIHLLIGSNRTEYLQKTIQQTIENNWRNIPLETLGIQRLTLSPRIKKAIKYVEEHRMNECKLINLSEHLGLSPGYFTQEFKRETGYSFRRFIQLTLNYYEEKVFPKLNISAKNMAHILGYSELSSFSRSFKRRQGVSPVRYIKKDKKKLNIYPYLSDIKKG